MLSWSKQEIDWYQTAESCTNYFTHLVKQIVRVLPAGASVHDIGCGIGSLALPLAEQGFMVTAVDSNPAAIEVVRRRAKAKGQSMTVLQADYSSLEGLVPYPVFCLCGDIRADLPLLRRWQSRKVVIVALDEQTFGFRQKVTPRQAVCSADVAAFLQIKGIPYRAESLAVNFDQPLRNQEDGLLFLQHHNQSLTEPQLSRLLEQWAVTNDHDDFPLRLPSVKRVSVFTFALYSK